VIHQDSSRALTTLAKHADLRPALVDAGLLLCGWLYDKWKGL
jgi:hypothetical protein